MLTDLPDMYRHCKSTEDRDMTPLDFITDHLINIDSVFDKHDNGDSQKPHQPIQTHHQGQVTVSFVSCFSFSISKLCPVDLRPSIPSNSFLPSDYTSGVFRPPIAA